MGNEIVILNNNKAVTTSLMVATVFGKLHKNVIRDIEGLLKFEPAQNSFEKSTYVNEQNGQEYPMYLMNRDGFTLLVMGYTGRKAIQFKLDYISAFNKMEQHIKEEQTLPTLPQNYSEALRMLADKVEENERQQKLLEVKTTQIAELNQAVAEMSEKVSYVDRILSSKSTILVTSIAQDYGMSAKHFNIVLRDLGIQHKMEGQWILYAKYLALGYVHSRAIEIPTQFGVKIKYNTEWTQKGRLFLYNTLKDHGYLPLIEQCAN